MRNNKRITLVCFAALAMTFTACTQDDDIAPALSGKAVSFSADIQGSSLRGAAGDEATTRTATGGNTWLTSDEVGIIMTTTGGALPSGIASGAGNVKYNPASTGASTSLTAEGAPIYWPETGTYDFVAYYPWLPLGSGGIDAATYTYPVDVSDQTEPALLDILHARTTGKTLGDNVAFTFAHTLSKLRVNIDAGGADAAFTATLTEMPTTALLALADGTLTGEGAVAPIAMHPVTAGDGYAATFEAILIPQAVGGYPGRLLMLTLDSGDTYAWDIPDTDALPQGKVRTYNLTVAAGVLSLTSSSIDDWTTRDNPSGELFVPGKITSAGALRKFAVEWNACYVSGNNEATYNNQYAVLQKWTDDAAKVGYNPPTGTVRLLADIDLTGTGDFPPIGSTGNPFCATFDGGGHIITGLTVNASSNRVGLFGHVGHNVNYPGTVRNLTLAGVSVTSTADYTSAVTGYLRGTIENVQVSGAVSGGYNTGGIVGNNNGAITGCSFSGTVSGMQYVGGIVGYNTSDTYSVGFVTGCSLAAGSKVTGTSINVGGIVGYNTNGVIIAACSVGAGVEVSAGSLGSSSYAGGIAGRNTRSSESDSYGTITGCWSAAAKVSGTGSYVGGVTGYNGGADTDVAYSFWLNTTTGGDQPDAAHGGGTGTTGCEAFTNVSGCNAKVADMNTALGTTYGWQWAAGANTATDWPTAEKQ